MLTQAHVPFADALPASTPLRAAHEFLLTLKKGCHVLVAVSGGGDSIGLLAALDVARLVSGRSDVRLSAVTVNHGLRAEAADEAAWVSGGCALRGIAHETVLWDAPKPLSGLMAAARHARYRLLCGEAERCGADVIAVAHTLDDQAETFAMRRARSASALATGMAEKTLIEGRMWVVRPFLQVGRGAIRRFLQAHGLSWIDDPSNDDTHFERVRTRQAIGAAVEKLAVQAGTAARERAAVSARRQTF
nr:tRNA lysidine(34) synthetase TilS [Marinicella sp. W31]MDC2877708.1 tRNA lysidine(34) synthetase TilS [Marinicella sp. W31]